MVERRESARDPYPFTSFDLNLIVEVRGECDPPKANALLRDGWTLLAASIDANGFPAFVLGRPVDDQGPHRPCGCGPRHEPFCPLEEGAYSGRQHLEEGA